MKELKFLTIFILLFVFAGCNSNNQVEEYHLEKRFWDSEDYEMVVRKIKFVSSSEKKPSYATPDKVVIFKKLVDIKNLSVILEDESLGISYRNEFASRMFDIHSGMIDSYSEINREDKFVYPMEIVDILAFGLYLQLHYFQLGNAEIKQQSDDPNDSKTRNLIGANIRTLISNYSNYLGYVKQEKAFSEKALINYCDVMDKYFTILVEKYPKENFNSVSKKAKAMLKKTTSKRVTTSLNKLLSKIESKKNNGLKIIL